MLHLHQRIALLTGVSLSVLGLASPAVAATNPGIEHAVTDADVDDLLTICGIGETCDFGVSENGAGLVTATVSDAASGQVRQIGTATGVDGDVLLQMINHGDVSLSAVASASDAGGMGTAIAVIAPPMVQSGHAPGNVSLDLSNDGTIEIHAVANATGSTYAFAFATAYGGIQQIANSTGTGDASIDTTNDGVIIAGATGHAESTGAAHVTAAAVYGIGAQAFAADGDVSIDLTNNGELDVLAHGSATGGHTGDAIAIAAGGMVAFATGAGAGDVSGVIANDGTLLVEADAHAVATTNALAIAIGVTGIYEVVHAATGTAFASIDNNGSIAVVANATATALVAQATAVGGGGLFGGALFQSAGAMSGTAGAAFDNSGEIEISAAAHANGSVIAYAYAFGGPGIGQFAFATGGDATADLSNSGIIGLHAQAEAVATNSANATALFANGFFNAAFVGSGGDAFANVTNDGTIDAAITAFASADGAVGAHAVGSHLVGNGAFSYGGGAAEAALANNGSIALVVNAEAVGASAIASATLGAVLYQNAGAIGSGSASGSIVNSGDVVVGAAAVAGASTADHGFGAAYASVQGFDQGASAVAARSVTFTTSGGAVVTSHAFGGVGPASLEFDNSGLLEVGGLAAAQGVETAAAAVRVAGGTQAALGTDVSVDLVNSGTMEFVAGASAVADTIAFANAYNSGIEQDARATEIVHQTAHLTGGTVGFVSAQLPLGPASASLTNDGLMTVGAIALADAQGGLDDATTFASGTVAYASAHASGVGQFVWGTLASAAVDNSGTLDVAAAAEASGEDAAGATVGAQGIRQGVNTLGASVADYYTSLGAWLSSDYNLSYAGAATASVDNSGTIEVTAAAEVSASDGTANASADARGIVQAAAGTSASIFADNSGDLLVAAAAAASGTTGRADAVAAGLTQGFSTGTDLQIEIVNSGSIDVHASAEAVQSNGATAIAAAIGLNERGVGIDSADLAFANSGMLAIEAVAIAEGGYFAGGTAYATGLSQKTLSPLATIAFDNSGQISVAASMQAAADADTGFAGATAFAHGYFANATNVAADVDNSGSLEVVAIAGAEGASGWAWATGAGIAVAAIGGTTFAPVYGELSGSIVNGGTIAVIASASGIADDIDTRASTAEAVGISLFGGALTGTVENSGTIDVSAIVASDDGLVSATGIKADGQAGLAGPDDVLTIVNDGGEIVVRQSVDGGESWQRGMAIDLGAAPNASVVNLLGNGSITGNIAIQAGDEINVEDGSTYFDGIINPALLPAGGVTEADLDSGLAGVGTLNIRDGGNLVLADPRVSGDPATYDGPAYAVVDTLNVAADGTLTFELEPLSGGVQDPGTYPQIFADQADLDGTLVAELATPGGLFADSYDGDNVIDANGRSGTFDQCKLGGGYAGSLFLDFSCSYDGGANVDLSLDRIAFDALSGLSGNRAAVAGALEDVYDPDLTGGFGAMFADLFLITDAGDYDNALNQLSGSAYANYLQSFASLGVHGNDLIDRASDCEDPAPGASSLSCRTGPLHAWGQIDYQWRKSDGDSEGGATSSRRMTGLMGIDAQVGEAAVVGVSAGAVSNYLRDRRFGDTIDADGGQFGLYAAFDPGAFFVKGVATYGWYDGTSRRHLDFTSLGGSLNGDAGGDPNVKMWTAGIHAGARLSLGSAAAATPYLNLDYVHARLGGFTEAGSTGTNLEVEGGKDERAIATGGVKLGAMLGSIRPEANVAYRHAFGDARSSFAAGFAADPSSSFDIVSASQSRDTLIAGASIGGRVGPVDLRIGYEGQFNGGATSHSGNFKIVVPLGGKR